MIKLEKNKMYLHPKYLFKFIYKEDSDVYTHFSPFYMVGNDIKIMKNTIDDTFDIKYFLYSVYNITDINSGIAWLYENIDVELVETLDRVFDLIWESMIEKKDLKNIKFTDKLVELYKTYFLKKYNLKPSYKLIEKGLKLVGEQYINTNLTFNSKKSFQKKIKKYINSNIE